MLFPHLFMSDITCYWHIDTKKTSHEKIPRWKGHRIYNTECIVMTVVLLHAKPSAQTLQSHAWFTPSLLHVNNISTQSTYIFIPHVQHDYLTDRRLSDGAVRLSAYLHLLPSGLLQTQLGGVPAICTWINLERERDIEGETAKLAPCSNHPI